MYKKNSFLILVIFLSFGSSQTMFRPLAQKALNAAKNILQVKYNNNNNLAKKTIAGGAGIALSAYGVHSFHSHKRNLTTVSISKEEKEIASRLINKASNRNHCFAHNEIYPWANSFFSLSPETRSMIREKLPNPWTLLYGYKEVISNALEKSPQLKKALAEERKILNTHGLSWYVPHEMPALLVLAHPEGAIPGEEVIIDHSHDSCMDHFINSLTPASYDTPISVNIGRNYQTIHNGMRIGLIVKDTLDNDTSYVKNLLCSAHAGNELRQPITKKMLSAKLPDDHNDLNKLKIAHDQQRYLITAHIIGKKELIESMNFLNSLIPNRRSQELLRPTFELLNEEMPFIADY